MSRNKSSAKTQDILRAQAEATLAQTQSKEQPALSAGDLLHELQVHQIELEMQNETLRQSLIQIEESRDHWVNFYEFSPLGYLTLNQAGLITEINLTGSMLLGEDRVKLIKRRFASLVLPDDRSRWDLHFLSVLQNDSNQICELSIKRGDGMPLFVQLNSLRLQKGNKTCEARIVLTDITERKQLQQDLRISEMLQYLYEKQEIFQTSMDGFTIIDAASHHILEVNQVLCDMSGYSREELLSMNIGDLEAVESPKVTAERVRKIIAIGYDRFETQHRHKLGHLIDVEVSVTHSKIKNGRLFSFYRDITDRKRIEKALVDSESFKTAILDSVEAEIAVIDRDGVIISVNEPWQRFASENSNKIGQPVPNTGVGDNYLQVCEAGTELPVNNEALRALEGIRSVLDGKLPKFSMEYPCDSPRQARWFLMNVTPWGCPVIKGAVITHIDISERKQTEDILRQSRDQLKVFVKQAPIGIAMFDKDMNYLAVSDCWMKDYSRGYADLIGRNHYVVHPDIPEQWKIAHQEAMQGESIENREDLWIHADGSKQWQSWAVLPWLDSDSQIGGVIISNENITKRKLLETEIAERHNETNQIQKLHVAAHTATAVAHEINQPLLAIASYSEAALMLLKKKKPDLNEVCNIIEQTAQESLRAGRSIRDIINFLNRGKFPTEAFDLGNEVNNIIAVAQSEHHLQFFPVLHLKKGLPSVQASRTHLQKALLNLIHNSIEAMQTQNVNSRRITFTLSSSKNKKYARLTIQDNGPGIKNEMLNRLFEPFNTDKSDGIGMGLSISRSLIEENGGQLVYEKNDGPGATFKLTLPFSK
jgi:PAS domain S-box-containing protein